MSDTLEISWAEVLHAASAGVQRQILNLRAARPDAHGFQGDGWGAHINGCLAEVAVAKLTGRYWIPVVRDFTALEGDVGLLQVRSTTRPNGCLIVHERDPDEAPFYLAVGPERSRAGLEFRVLGPILGRDAKRREWWKEPVPGRPAYFVPQSALGSTP